MMLRALQHVLCIGRAARMTAIFLMRLCKAILSDFSNQLRTDGVSKELDYFESKNVWRRAPLSGAHRTSGRPPITVRRVDFYKNYDDCPDIRSRLVARQIRGSNEDPMFTPTPPLEAFRTVLINCLTDLEGEAPKCRADR